jgi:hypothetical protein
MAPAAAPPAPAPGLGRARGLAGAALGAGIGAGAWALLASLAGTWSGWAALPLGALAGFASKRSGGRGTAAAAGAAALALAGIFVGQGFAARAKHEGDLRGRLAAVDRERYDDLAAAADDWDPRLRGDEVAKFAFKHGFVTFGSPGGVQARVAEFRATTVPVLEEWKRRPPAFEAWREGERARIRAGPSAWAAYLADPPEFLSPLDLLCALLGAAAAARLANAPAPPRTFRRRGEGPPA